MKLWQIKRWFLGDVPPPWPLRSHKLNQKSIKIKPNRNIWVHSFNRMTLSSASFVTTTTKTVSHWTLQIPTRYSLISEFLFVFCRFLRKLCCQFSATLNTSMPTPEKNAKQKREWEEMKNKATAKFSGAKIPNDSLGSVWSMYVEFCVSAIFSFFSLLSLSMLSTR